MKITESKQEVLAERRCYSCGSDNTVQYQYPRVRGVGICGLWYTNKPTDLFLCNVMQVSKYSISLRLLGLLLTGFNSNSNSNSKTQPTDQQKKMKKGLMDYG
jgi:hypothetical protein